MGANAQTSVPAFTVGQVLTAAQVTGINTGIPVFASSTERDAAFGGTGEKTLAEGQMAYLEDTNATQYYDGSSWAAIAGGKIIAVKHAYKTDTFSASLTTGSNAAITDLSISHSLSNSANKVLMFGAVHGDSGRYFQLNAALAIDDTLYVGDADGNRIRTGSTSNGSRGDGQAVTNLSAVFEPGDTSSHDYEAFSISTSNDTKTAYVNRSTANTNDEGNQRPVSWIVLMEVSA